MGVNHIVGMPFLVTEGVDFLEEVGEMGIEFPYTGIMRATRQMNNADARERFLQCRSRLRAHG